MKAYNFLNQHSVVVCTYRWGKELHRQVGVDIVMISENPEMWVWVLLSAQYFPFPMILYKLHVLWLLNYINTATACIYVIVSIKRLTISGERVW